MGEQLDPLIDAVVKQLLKNNQWGQSIIHAEVAKRLVTEHYGVLVAAAWLHGRPRKWMVEHFGLRAADRLAGGAP
jgi:HD superfamily phosphohydrolase YqeK